MAPRLRFSAARAYAHLREADPVLERLIARWGPFRPRPASDPYASLVRSVLRQQLAGAAADAIERRWHALYGLDPIAQTEPPAPPPDAVLGTTDQAFRAAGVSRQKAAALRDIAQHVVEGRLDFARLGELPDAEVIPHLTAVRGVGEWTAHMFLLFHMGRPDVLPIGDLGVRRGMQMAYGLAEEPTPQRASQIGEPWAPYRSVGSWYMWRALEAPEGAAT